MPRFISVAAIAVSCIDVLMHLSCCWRCSLCVGQIRMPSGMQGAKRDVLEGGIRNFLSVKGPGVAQGAVRDELLGVIDVLPTMVQLARIQMVRSAAAAAAADYGVDGRWWWRGAAGHSS